MAKKKANFGGKLLIAAACAATIAQYPIAQANAYSEMDYTPSFATTFGIQNTDFATASFTDADGNYLVGGAGELQGSTDTAILAKYSPSGKMLWGLTLGGSTPTGSYVSDIDQIKSGNYIVLALIDGKTTIFEITPDGSIATNSEQNSSVKTLALDEANSQTYFAAVDGESDSIYIYVYNPQTNGYALMNATNIQDGNPIYNISPKGDNGYVAVGFDEDENSGVLYIGDDASDYPEIKLIEVRGATFNQVVPYGDGYIGVGTKSDLPYIAKINADGTVTPGNDYILGSTLAEGRDSQFSSVDVLDNGQIVAVGYTNFTGSSVITPKGGTDAIIARFDSNIDLIEAINPSGNGNDEFETVTANGNKFFVGGASSSTDLNVPFVGNEVYSLLMGYANGVEADVTFNIEGDIPEGVDVPEDGTFSFTEDGNTVPKPESTDDAIFNGWYLDEDMTKELGNTVPSDDLDLYGKYNDVETENLNDLDTFDHWCEYQNEGTLLICTNPEDNTITAGETSDPFTPQVPSIIMDDAANGKWVSDDPTIATVDQNGKVTGVSEGTTNIRFVVYDKNGNIIYEYVLSFTVKAAANPDTVDVTPMILTIAAFSAVSFAAIFRRAFNKR